ncbi:Di-trans-poly-cis-decaprenylcistransferase-like protein [Candidatus Magnetoovum chiemensis]|nr:Di-trans-poly-cis-decaprenylcistransferase-like protein [Candidatus Magnetoovum chiemensis]
MGIIMDGNGRWANLRGLPRVEGHKQGVHRSKDIIDIAINTGIKSLTLYAFSVENWKRPEAEVQTLMELLSDYLYNEVDYLLEKGARFKIIGNKNKLSPMINYLIARAEEMTADNTGMTLLLAVSYGGRDEIIRTVRKMALNGYDLTNLKEEDFQANLDTEDNNPVDLIIRTGGEQRLSNFLIWQAAYSELYFTDTLWPDFTKDEFYQALHSYKQRERRFGSAYEKVSLNAD